MITDNYIKMCEKAEEIQKLKKGKNQFNNQDFVAYNFGQGLKVYVCSEISRFWTIQDLIWLPTQEQLQEMILEKWSPFAKVNKFRDYILFDSGLIASRSEESINELWLMYVMKEKYQKIWTGENWVKEVTNG